MNYELMSDFEINENIAVKRGFIVDKEQYEGLCDRDERIVLCRDNFDISVVFDPCNNPADAWPVIIENKISIINDVSTWEASIDFDGDLLIDGTDEVLTKHYAHKNPLRAAMIVFLMMQND